MENNENSNINIDKIYNNSNLEIIPEEKTSDSASLNASKSEDIKYEAEIINMPENYQSKNSLKIMQLKICFSKIIEQL